MLKRFRPELLVFACTLLGLFLRTHRLSELPPGLFWDEAFDGFDALRILQTGTVPVFFEGNTGREPLTIHLQAIGMLLWGTQVWVLRLIPAMLGILTIAGVYRVAAALFQGEKRGRWLAALSAGMLAVSFWHVDVSRLSLRVISFPLLSTLVVCFFGARGRTVGGAIIPDSFEIRVPPDAHPGKYRFEVGLLDRIAFDQLLPLLGTQDRLLLEPITVNDGPINERAIPYRLSLRLGDPTLMTLLGYNAERAAEGESLRITLYWRAEQPAPRDYSVFVHVLDSAGQLKGQRDRAPMNGYAPTSWWQPGDLFRDVCELTIPKELAASGMTVELGVYDPADGVRLPLFDASGARQPEDH